MNIEEKIIFKGLDYSVSGKKAFIRKILSIPETRDIFLSHIVKSEAIEKLELRNKFISFDSKFRSVSLNEEDLVKLFDLTTSYNIESFLNDSRLSDTKRTFYSMYLAPLQNSDYSKSFKIDYFLIYGIVNQERCHIRLKEIWLEHPEYYLFYLKK